MPATDSTAGSGLPSSGLLRGLRARQPEAWQRFLRLYGPLVYSWCRTRWRLPPADAADVLQDVVTRALESIGDFRDGNFLAWLAAITRSRAANHLRRNPTRAVGGSDAQRLLAELADPHDPEETTGELGAPAESGGVLRRAIEEVRARAAPASWRAFWQVTVEGRNPADVAAELGMTRNAVYIANSRILSRLRTALGEFNEGSGS